MIRKNVNDHAQKSFEPRSVQNLTVSKYAQKKAAKVKPRRPGQKPSKYLGIVNWFNWEKKFGTIVTNGQVYDNERGAGKKIVELFIHIKNCAETPPPQGGWVEFVECNVHNGKECAYGVRPVVCDDETLKIALRYKGEFASIVGSVPRNHRENAYYNENILTSIVKETLAIRKSPEYVRKVLRDAISSLPQEEWDEAIDAVIGASGNVAQLREIYLPQETYAVSDDDVITVLLQSKLADIAIIVEGVAVVSKFPPWYDLRRRVQVSSRTLGR